MRQAFMLILIGGACGAAAMLWLDRAGPNGTPEQARSTPLLDRVELPEADTGSAARATNDATTLVPFAANEPRAALDEALRIADPVQRQRAAELVAARWAASDPQAALAATENVPGALRQRIRAVVDGAWARVDTAGYRAFLASNPRYVEELLGLSNHRQEPIEARSPGMRLLLASDPVGVLELADTLPSRLRSTLQTSALSAYAERDPFAAMAYVERTLGGEQRGAALAAVATGYALADPEGALAWAQSLSPAPSAVLANVLQGVAQNDMARAIAIGMQSPGGSVIVGNVPEYPALSTLILGAAEDPVQAVRVADILAETATDAARRDYFLRTLLSRWSERDPDSAIDWVRANARALSEEVLTGAAVAIASNDPALAASYTPQIPAALRETWIARVSQGFARADPVGALDWLAEYRGQPGYETGMRLAVVNYAMNDPAAAARLLDNANADLQLATAGVVADAWARRDGQASADWARGLNDAGARAVAVPEAVGAWMSQSAQAAEDWTLRLPPGADRDRALRVLLQGRRFTDQPRESYSNHSAESLLAQIGNPELRREVEGWFAAPDARGR